MSILREASITDLHEDPKLEIVTKEKADTIQNIANIIQHINTKGTQ